MFRPFVSASSRVDGNNFMIANAGYGRFNKLSALPKPQGASGHE